MTKKPNSLTIRPAAVFSIRQIQVANCLLTYYHTNAYCATTIPQSKIK